MNRVLVKYADYDVPGSFSANARKKRFLLFIELLCSIKKDRINILDLGGTTNFWKSMGMTDKIDGKNIFITLFNIRPQPAEFDFISTVAGDINDLSCFKEKQFDIVFSNSAIEHLGTYEAQKRMSLEVERIGIRYFIQTPNRHFPIEPHFLFPYFQFLPTAVKIFLIKHFNLGWYSNVRSDEEAVNAINKIRLLTFKEFRLLFPQAFIYREKVLGLTKSFIAYKF